MAGSACSRRGKSRPVPACSVLFITNAGVYVRPAGTSRGSRFRGIVDWGVMVNASPRHAIGGSWFVTLDEESLGGGVALAGVD